MSIDIFFFNFYNFFLKDSFMAFERVSVIYLQVGGQLVYRPADICVFYTMGYC